MTRIIKGTDSNIVAILATIFVTSKKLIITGKQYPASPAFPAIDISTAVL